MMFLPLHGHFCRSAETPRKMFSGVLGLLGVDRAGGTRSTTCGACFSSAPLTASAACPCSRGA